MLKQKIQQTLLLHQLLPRPQGFDGWVLVALSGGADSVALLRVLLDLGYNCEAAHCNFHLRGDESDRDELFATQLCKHLGVKLHVAHFDTRQVAASRHVSIEMAARDLRYDFFSQCLEHERLDCVAVAHHKDDNVETILLNLVRGTGLQGLTGMAYRRNNIIRPMLDVSRHEILQYLTALGQDFITDSSNLEADVKRNILRLRVLPILRELNPSVADAIMRTAANLTEAQQLVEQQVAEVQQVVRNDGAIIISKDQIASHLILFNILNPLGFTPSQIDDVWQGINNTPGAIYKSATHELLRDRDALIVRNINDDSGVSEVQLPLDMPTTLCGQTLVASIVTAAEIGCELRNPHFAFIDADKVGEHLIMRRPKTGERFTPYGMTGSKLVSQYMKDHKYDAFQKQAQLVVANSEGIVWLVGQRIDNHYAIDAKSATRILRIELRS